MIALLVLVVAAYYAYTRGLPWLQERIETRPAAETEETQEARRCVEAAAGANDLFAGQIRDFARPPVDRDAWARVFLNVEFEIARADSTCSCAAAACATASAALAELRELVLEFDRQVKGISEGFSNPARRQERIYDLLDQASRQAG